MSVFFGKGTNQNCALLPAPSFWHSASPLFNLTLALAQIIYKNLSYFPRIVERGDTEWLKAQTWDMGPPTAMSVVIFDTVDTDVGVGVKRLQNVSLIEVESESSAVEQQSSMSY